MFFTSKKVLGLDIGVSSIKMAEVDYSKPSLTINKFIQIKTPSGIFSGSEIQNTDLLAKTIQSLAQSIQTNRKLISFGIWGPSVIVKKIAIPKVEKKMLAEQIKWEIEQYIPFDPNEIVTTYHVIGSGSYGDSAHNLTTSSNTNHGNSSSSGSMDILLVAVQKSFLHPFYEAISKAGFDVSVVDVHSFALANIFEINYGMINDVVALFNIGFNNTNMVILHNGKVIFSRDLPIGGSNYTQEISKDLGITFEEAESLKLSYFSGSESPSQLPEIIRSQSISLCDEIRNGIDFFSASSSNLNLKRCYITGGGSLVPELLPLLSKTMNVPFEELNPLKNVKFGKSVSMEQLFSSTHFCAIVLGLAMRQDKDS